MTTRGISPKLTAAVVAAVVAHLLGQTVLELPPVAVLALQVVSVALAAYKASPGSVVAAVDSLGRALPVGGVGVGPDPEDVALGDWSPAHPDVNVGRLRAHGDDA